MNFFARLAKLAQKNDKVEIKAIDSKDCPL